MSHFDTTTDVSDLYPTGYKPWGLTGDLDRDVFNVLYELTERLDRFDSGPPKDRGGRNLLIQGRWLVQQLRTRYEQGGVAS